MDGREKNARVVSLFYGMSSQMSMGVHNNSLRNLGRALHERVFRVSRNGALVEPPRPVVNAFLSCSEFRTRWVERLDVCPKFSHQQVCDRFTSAKKKLYEQAMESLKSRPLERSDAYTTAFVKAEKINRSRKVDPAPRLIQPRSVRYNVELGSYLRLNEHRMLVAIDRVFGSTTVMKGLNVEQVGSSIAKKWAMFGSPVGIGLDASRFDQHCSIQALEYEHSFYTAVFPNDKHLQKMLGWQLHNKGWGNAVDGTIKYEVEGCRMSGDINTSLGNCIIMCGLVYTYLKEKGVTAELVNNGDDNVIICETNDMDKLSDIGEWFLQKGYTLVLEEPVYELEKVEFCQSQPINVGGHYKMVRQPKNCLAKDAVSLSSIRNETDMKTTLSAVGMCNMVINSGVPVQYAAAERMWQKGNRKEVHFDLQRRLIGYGGTERIRNLKLRNHSISDTTRLSYFKAFGIDPDTQMKLEEYYGQVELDWLDGPLTDKNTDLSSDIKVYSQIPQVLIEGE